MEYHCVQKHLKAPSPTYDHSNTTGQAITVGNVSMVGREDQNLTRTIKEIIYIRVNNPSLTNNIDKYQMLHVWDEVLFYTP